MESHTSGTMAGTGSFRCSECGHVLSLATADALPRCPSCGGMEYTRASLFTSPAPSDAPTALAGAPEPWLDEVRATLTEPGRYVAYRDGERPVIVTLTREWTRIGRSLSADVRFDDPTVSRRHALIALQDDGVRVLDDRSLNGVFVNGERVEWSPLHDGDEILVGRHRLRFIELTAAAVAGDERAARWATA